MMNLALELRSAHGAESGDLAGGRDLALPRLDLRSTTGEAQSRSARLRSLQGGGVTRLLCVLRAALGCVESASSPGLPRAQMVSCSGSWLTLEAAKVARKWKGGRGGQPRTL